MRNFEGTQGKWSVNGEPYKSSTVGMGYVGEFEILNKEGARCAQVHAYEFFDITLHEARSNAKLIAAAPEILEALQQLIDPTTGLVFDAVAKFITSERAYKIEQAISKALD